MSPDRWTKILSLTFAVFSFLVNLAQVLDLSRSMRFIVGLGTAVSAGTALMFFLKAKKYENALRLAKLPKKLESADRFHFTFVTSEAAFAEIVRTSGSIYGNDNVPLERSLSWWRQFPRGVFAAYWQPPGKAPEIAGYVSIWPVKRSTYQKLRRGRMRESEIAHQSIDGVRTTHPRKFWYVSNIVVARSRRRVLRELIEQAIRNWVESGHLDANVSVLALAYSKEGAGLLRRFGFKELSVSSADGWPVFELETSTETLEGKLTVAAR